MRRLAVGLLLLTPSCAGSAPHLRPDTVAARAEVRLCKAVDVRSGPSGVLGTDPVEVGDVFYASDWQVLAWVSLGPLAKSHRIRFVWYDPSGERYLDSGEVTANPAGGPKRHNQMWHALRLWGERAAKRPGRWNVTIYLDGDPLSSRDFTIRVR